MANMFARSTLTTWDGSSGAGNWSNTSGGVSNGTWPVAGTNVIFDSLSGSPRAINLTDTGSIGGPACASVDTSLWGAGGSFTGIVVNISGAANFTGLTSAVTVNFTGTNTLTSGGCTIGVLQFSSAVSLTLQDDLVITSSFSTTGLTTFNANNKNVTAPSFAPTTGTWNMGSGTWTLTGTGTPFSGGGTINANTSTIKFTNNSASAKLFDGQSKTYNNLWIATQGSGVVTISGVNTFNNLKVNPGSILQLPPFSTTTVASMTLDGTGNPATLNSSTSSSTATLAKSGGGSVYLDYCSIKDITGSPVSTWNARNSTNVSNNNNINFIPGNSRFLSFF